MKRLLVFILISSLVFSSFFCCCLSESAHAKDSNQHVAVTSKSSHCDTHNSEKNHSDGEHKCECPKFQGDLAKSFDSLKAADVISYTLNYQIVLDKIFISFAPDSHNLLAGASPPLQLYSSSVPLYIKNPTLRI